MPASHGYLAVAMVCGPLALAALLAFLDALRRRSNLERGLVAQHDGPEEQLLGAARVDEGVLRLGVRLHRFRRGLCYPTMNAGIADGDLNIVGRNLVDRNGHQLKGLNDTDEVDELVELGQAGLVPPHRRLRLQHVVRVAECGLALGDVLKQHLRNVVVAELLVPDRVAVPGGLARPRLAGEVVEQFQGGLLQEGEAVSREQRHDVVLGSLDPDLLARFRSTHLVHVPSLEEADYAVSIQDRHLARLYNKPPVLATK